MKFPLLNKLVIVVALLGIRLLSYAQPQQVTAPTTTDGGQTQVKELIFSSSDLTANNSSIAVGGTLDLQDLTVTSRCGVGGVRKITLSVRLDMGEVYNLGTSSGQSQLQVTVTGKSGSGFMALPAPMASGFSVQVDASHPTQVVVADLTGLPTLTGVQVTVTQRPSAPPSALRLVARLEQTLNLSPPAVGTLLSPIGSTLSGFEQTFTWRPICAFTTKYQVQLLKAVNPTVTAGEWAARAILLEKALSPSEQLALQTGGSGEIALTTTVAEGPGQYFWRVRAIGNLPGGIANPANWGGWTNGSAMFTLSDAGMTNLNWIYHRTFSEDGRVSERLSFANRLLHTRQVQTRLASTQQIIALQTVQDYVGRDALRSLPIPLPGATSTGRTTLGFRSNLLTAVNGAGTASGSYAPVHFDSSTPTNNTYLTPSKALEPLGYYSGSLTGMPANDGVPSAEGVPFVRTLYSLDGLNRVREESQAGPILGLHAAGAPTHTVRTAYASVAQSELDYMFGTAEAPRAVNTYKIVTQDANNVASVNYQTKAGQTIATALSGTSGASTLTPLPSAGGGLTVLDRLDDKTSYNGIGSLSTKLIVVPAGSPTELKYTYKIKPQAIIANLQCEVTFCSTCDYHIEVRLRNMDDLDAQPICLGVYDVPFDKINCSPTEFTPAMQACPTGTTSATGGTYQMQPGTYALEKIVTTYNTLTGTSHTYLDDKLADLQQQYEALKTAPNSIWSTANGINSFLSATCPRVADLYAYLSTSPKAKPVLNSDGVLTAYQVPFDCTTIEIPVLDLNCGQDTRCREPNEYLDYLRTEAPNFPVNNVAAYFPGLSSTSDLQSMFEAMQQDPNYKGRCTEMWNCWQGVVAGYLAIESAGATAGGSTSGNSTTNLLQSFLDCLQAPITNYISNTAGLTPQNIYYTGIFDPNDQYQQLCFKSLVDASNNPIYSANSGSFNPAMTHDDYEQLAACVGAALVAANPGSAPTGTDVQTTIDQMVGGCQKRCDDHRQEFEQGILRDFRRQGIYTYLDQWVLQYQPGDDSKIRDIRIKIADIQQKIQDVQSNLTTGQLTAWIKLQELYAQQTSLSSRTPQTCAISNQLAALQQKIDVLEQQVGGALNDLRNLNQELADLQNQLLQLQPSTYITSLKPFGPSPVDPNGNPVVQACEIAQMVEELVQACRGNCELDVPLNPNGTAQNNPPIDPKALAQFQNVITGVMEVTVRPIDEGCEDGYTPTPVNTKNTTTIDITQCAVDVISYTSELASKFTSLPGFPNHRFRASSGSTQLLPCPGINQQGIGEKTVNNLSYVGPLSKDCNRVFDDECGKDANRENYWVAVQDSRDGEGGGGENNYMFRILWLGYNSATAPPNDNYSVVTNSPYRNLLCLPSGEDPASVPKLVDGDACRTTDSYLIQFMNAQTRKLLSKDDIASISRPFVDVSGGQLAGYADPFSPDNISVDIQLTGGRGQVRARIVGVDERLARFLKWKDVTTCQVEQRQYATCYRWVQPVMPPYQGGYDPLPPTCEEAVAEQLRNRIAQQQDAWIQTKLASYRQQYAAQCADPASLDDNFSFNYRLGYHHFTLYYRDRNDNLIKTVPPQGVNITDPTKHLLATTYEYNSLKQLVRETTPDGGVKNMIYNRAGQLRFSVNDKQTAGTTTAAWAYAYTNYDALGRVVTVGEQQAGTNLGGQGALSNRADLLNVLQLMADGVVDAPQPLSTQPRVQTVYNNAAAVTYLDSGNPADIQQHLANRVSYTVRTNGNASDQVTTYYSYDPHGNVVWLAQDVPRLGRKYTRYEYDLLSNKVLRVSYQAGQPDQFYHRYAYADDNRLTEVYTSADGQLWDRDATYQYYAHGPLKRLELGQDRVQGIDYTYTLQGWLKAVNHSNLDPNKDPGHDGPANQVGADAFGMTLGYFDGDYVRAQSPLTASNANGSNPDLLEPGAKSLYNGNIATWQARHRADVATAPGAASPGRVNEQYGYDQLNRLLSSAQRDEATGAVDGFATSYSYDANGNLLNLNRYQQLPAQPGQPLQPRQQIDALSYEYPRLSSGALTSNRLRYVRDGIAAGVSAEDVDDQPHGASPGPADLQADNYQYDGLGNLVSDKQGGVTSIEWTLDNKIGRIRRDDPAYPGNDTQATFISYVYDAMGNRVRKTEQRPGKGSPTTHTYYVRDAQGNPMAIYKREELRYVTQTLTLVEQPLYGSQRLGERRPDLDMLTGSEVAVGTYTRELGRKVYELSDHLGNVRAVVSDEKLRDPNSSGHVAGLRAYYNYYPFGMLQPGRYYPGNNVSSNQGGYRYGYNGQEKADEIDANHNTALFWEYDSRVARRWNVDPATAKYSNESPYLAFHDNSIFFTDPLGNDPPEGFKKISGKGGDLDVPQSTTTTAYKSDGKNYHTGDVQSFTIGSKIFSAQYGSNGEFDGYYNGTDKYQNPDISLRKNTGIQGLSLKATFDVKGVPASGLQIIQTVYTSRQVGLPVGNTMTLSGGVYDAFVDGGINSPPSLGVHIPAVPGMPYHYDRRAVLLPSAGSLIWRGTNGSITANDYPSAAFVHKVTAFETIVIATNYMGTGLDVKLGTFKWGWTNFGENPIHKGGSGINFTTQSEDSKKILSHDYPTYQFFK